MQKLLLIALLCVSLSGYAQTIRRVNNNPSLNDPSIYPTAQAAHDAAVAGDIIQLEPSSFDYGDLTVTKKLTIMGAGYMLDNNPNTPSDKRNAKLGTVTFGYGSAKSTAIGLEVIYINVNAEEVMISRSLINSSVIIGYSFNSSTGKFESLGHKAIISQNLIRGYISTKSNEQTNSSLIYYNCIVNNNIIGGDISGVGVQPSGAFSSLIVNNNVFAGFTYGNLLINVTDAVFTNNIIDASRVSVSNSSFKVFANSSTVNIVSFNNLCTTVAGLPSGNGNVNNADASKVFKSADPFGRWNYSYDFLSTENNLQLSDNSPAKTVGAGKTPIGIFAGSRPYVPSGLPNIPIITTFMSSGFGTTSTPLNITTSIRSNN